MIKFLSMTIGTFVATVGFLYYLIQNSNFIPFDVGGKYLTMNVVTLLFLLFIAFLCMSMLIIFCIRYLFFKQCELRTNINLSIKYGLLLSIGILVVYLLHFFHILNFTWGIAILIVVILSLFVI
jgi:hypothetical protein